MSIWKISIVRLPAAAQPESLLPVKGCVGLCGNVRRDVKGCGGEWKVLGRCGVGLEGWGRGLYVSKTWNCLKWFWQVTLPGFTSKQHMLSSKDVTKFVEFKIPLTPDVKYNGGMVYLPILTQSYGNVSNSNNPTSGVYKITMECSRHAIAHTRLQHIRPSSRTNIQIPSSLNNTL